MTAGPTRLLRPRAILAAAIGPVKRPLTGPPLSAEERKVAGLP
jgi:hypothetical protein